MIVDFKKYNYYKTTFSFQKQLTELTSSVMLNL